ncbi:response regulator [Paremcibacter congregatus]|uniref:response regulator n=1 Tax=Paremcibacter congregatus TaxID=2043170 RepID=UPI0030ECF8C3|tara:strand:- start:690 stop:1460 length:771 start_codon:yes stop_codon:yes gene_type:complete
MSVLSEEAVDALYESEAIEEAQEVAANLELRLQQMISCDISKEAAHKLMMQDSSNLRLKVKAVSLPGLNAICQRLDEYLWHIKEISMQNITDLQQFSDRISKALEGGEGYIEDVAEEIRNLPHHSTFNIDDIKIVNKEVTLVLPQKVAARVVERELVECGYRVNTVLDSLQAFEIILETKPDLVICSAMLPRLSGVDLICALRAMPTTQDVHVALLTSLELNHPDLRKLPMNVGIIRRGEAFGSDLADVLQRFNIT